jgi:hypothetical protein
MGTNLSSWVPGLQEHLGIRTTCSMMGAERTFTSSAITKIYVVSSSCECLVLNHVSRIISMLTGEVDGL